MRTTSPCSRLTRSHIPTVRSSWRQRTRRSTRRWRRARANPPSPSAGAPPRSTAPRRRARRRPACCARQASRCCRTRRAPSGRAGTSWPRGAGAGAARCAQRALGSRWALGVLAAAGGCSACSTARASSARCSPTRRASHRLLATRRRRSYPLPCSGREVRFLFWQAGFARLAAGRAAILIVSELAFAWCLDVALLREPTTPLASAGTAAVLCGCTLVGLVLFATGGDEDERGLRQVGLTVSCPRGRPRGRPRWTAPTPSRGSSAAPNDRVPRRVGGTERGRALMDDQWVPGGGCETGLSTPRSSRDP